MSRWDSSQWDSLWAWYTRHMRAKQLDLFSTSTGSSSRGSSGMRERAFSAAGWVRKKTTGIPRCYGCDSFNGVRELPAESGMKGVYCRECVP